jgi:hypothetical protein
VSRNTISFCILFSFLFSLVQCGKSFWEKGKENVIRTLVDALLEQGEYIIFWDGKNDNKQAQAPGKYWCRLRTLEFESQIEMNGLDGGKDASADNSGYIPSRPLHFSIEQNFPNPFYMKNGTNIPFTVPHSVNIQLTIRNKE